MRRFFVALAAVLAGLGGAQAHHPGSHATREKDGRVRVEVVATVGESCLVIGTVRTGTPPTVLPPPGATPVTAEVERVGSVCTPVARVIRAEQLFEIGAAARQIFLYVVGPDGDTLSTERIPLR